MDKKKKDAKTLFNNLRRSTAYDFFPKSEEIKLHIIEGLYKNRNDILSLFQQQKERAFGYVVERAAILSPSIPKNKSRAQKIADFLLGELGDSSGHVGFSRNLYNPDFLWITIQGNTAAITGLGEVKSGLEAFQRKPKQLFLAAKNLPQLIQKANSENLPITKGLTLKLTQNLLLQLIVPKGEKARIQKHFPYGVRRDGLTTQELEFSVKELIFITQQLLCPDYKFRPKMRFSKNEQARYEDAVESFITFCVRATRKIFEENEVLIPDNPREVTIFALATQKLAIHPKEIDFATKVINSWWPLLIQADTHVKKLPKHFSRWREYFMLTNFAEEKDCLSLFFLTLQNQAKKLTETQKSLIENMAPIDLFEYL
ncbi:hypothetical protein IIA95_01805 [Patescibacteria group bacterium]|nr:hypothetical protein [Patescibacteria group bacterium]